MTKQQHNFLPFSSAVFADAGEEGLAVRLSTQFSPKYGMARHFGFLLNAETGKSLLRELATALEQKYPDDVITD